MVSRPSAWPLPRTRTTQLHGDRRRQGPGRRGTSSSTRHGDRSPLLPSRSSSAAKKSLAGAGHLDADAPVPIGQCAEIWNLEEDIMDAARLLDRQFAEQVIEVPIISCSPCPSRVPISEPQTAEQLVEVPTVLSLALLHQTAEQTVDIPSSRFSLPRQSSTVAGAEQSVDIPVRGRLHGFLPGQRSTQRTQDFHLGQGSTVSSSGPARLFHGFFRTFPRPIKSAKVGARSRSELA